MKIAPTLALLCLVGFTSPSHAQAWNTVISQNGQTLDFDAASVEEADGVVTFTARTTFSQPSAYTASDGQPLEDVSVAIESYAVDCSAHTYTDRGVRYSNAAGELIAGNRSSSTAKPLGSVTQSLVGGLLPTLCPS